MSDDQQAGVVADNRTPSLGLGRLVMALFWVFGVIVTLISVKNLAGDSEAPLGPRFVALLASAVYVIAAVGLTHNGRRMRVIAWASLVISLVGPLIVGVGALGLPSEYSLSFSPWAQFGTTYWGLPLVIPLVGMVWMWWSDPRRIVEIAEGLERPRRRVK